MLPNFLIVGAARAATTWIAKNLSLHPQVYLPTKKEIHFFDLHYSKGIHWYKAIFQSRTEQELGEATPAYLYFEHVPRLICRHIPDVKLIVSLRNPIHRAYSHYWNIIAKVNSRGKYPGITFEEMLDSTPRLIEEGMYARKLKKYFDVFPRDNLLILFYDQLEENPNKFLETIYSFLRISKVFASPLLYTRINAKSQKLGTNYIFYTIYRISMRAKMYNVANCLAKIYSTPLPEINIDTRKMLFEGYYYKEICELEELLSINLSIWKTL